MPDTTLTSAVNELKEHQRQLDMDGVEVGVSRQALDIVLLSLARAGLEAGKADEWLPIETAPKDGTKLLLGRFTNGKDEIDHNGYMVVDHWRSPPQHDFTGWGKFNMQYWPATHWRHLPAPPAIRALPLTTEGGDKP